MSAGWLSAGAAWRRNSATDGSKASTPTISRVASNATVPRSWRAKSSRWNTASGDTIASTAGSSIAAHPFYLSGAFTGYIGSCVDVTDRIEAQEAAVRRRLADLKEIRALLPICSRCHQIRDDQGNWQSLEHYVSERSMTEFSHGICPSCESR